ncbi:FtsK/SpoIIIE domain-containing protein [Sphaerimonospora mesophila]|uniref:FtsK/SpoIIIE domain-containing protein n=1 Tax=Sphaerimonospora mesophila TaxID=37483 RepID=UPI0006E2330B
MSQPAEEHEGIVLPFRPATLVRDAPDVPDALDEPIEPAPRDRVLTAVRVRARSGALRLATVRTPRRPVRATLRHAGYGLQGLSRGAGRWWRWVTTAEYDRRKDVPPVLVETVRRRRRRTSYTLAGLTLGGGFAGWLVWWPGPVLAAGVALGVASAVEQHITRKAAREQGREALGPNPGSKAVRRAVAAAGELGKFDDIRVLSPGVVRLDGAWSALVELPPGVTAAKAVRRRLELAAAVGVGLAQVSIDPVKGHAGRFELWVADDDPLAGDAIASPLVSQTEPFNIWSDKVAAGVDVRGRPIAFRLPERSLLTGGEPGAGKSVASNNLLCAAGLDPRTRLALVDGKGGADLLDYEPICERFLDEPDVEAVLGLLTDYQEEMTDRYRKLKQVGAKKVTAEIAEELDMHPILLHIDELQVFTTDEKNGKNIVNLLWDLVSRGRASGITVSGATQRPAAEVVPSKLRDILSIRWAMRCTTPQASDTILGQGWAGRGFNAALLDSTQRGAGFLLAEGALPQPMRTYFIGDDEVKLLMRRAYRFRELAGTLPKSDARPGVRLLKAVLAAFADEERRWTIDLLSELTTHQGFEGWTADQLADALRPYGVTPGQVNIGGTNRNGYRRGDVLRALERA